MKTLNISGVDRVAIVKALYKHSRAQNMGLFAEAGSRGILSEENAREAAGWGYVDYLQGRVLKVDLRKDELNPYLYDRDLGDGACERALQAEGLIP